DFVPAQGTLTFLPGETVKQVVVPTSQDTVFEPDETFLVKLSGPTNAVIADDRGLGTVQNDDPRPTVQIVVHNPLVVEGDSGTQTVQFDVSLSNLSSQTVTVTYATANRTAVGNVDYVPASGTLTFAPMTSAAQTVTVLVRGDTVF